MTEFLTVAKHDRQPKDEAMGSIAMTRMVDGTTKTVAVPLTPIAFTDLFGSMFGKGVMLEGEGKECAVRICLSDAEARDVALRLNAIFARAGRAQDYVDLPIATAVPPLAAGDAA